MGNSPEINILRQQFSTFNSIEQEISLTIRLLNGDIEST